MSSDPSSSSFSSQPTGAASEAAGLRRRLKRLRHRMARRGRLLRLMAGGTSTGLWYFDLAKQVLRWSYIGLTDSPGGKAVKGEASLSDFSAAIHPEDRARFDADIAESLKEGLYQSEYRIYSTTANRYVFARVTGQVEYAADGRPTGILAVMVDLLRDLEQQQERLQHEAQLAIVMSEQGNTLLAQDEELRFLWFNNPELPPALLGFIGKTDYELGEHLRNPQLTALKEEVVATGEERRYEGWMQVLGLGERYLRVIYRPYPLPNGRQGVLCKSIDLTETVKADADIIIERSLFRLSLSMGSIAAFAQDADLRYRWVFDPITGFEGNSIIGKTDAEMGFDVPELAQGQSWKKEVLEKGILVTHDAWIMRQGRRIHVRYIAEPYTLPDGTPGLIGVAIDITNLKQQEDELQQQTARLEQEKANTQALLGRLERELAAKRLELDEARQMQMSMMPKRSLELRFWQMATYMQTSEEVGGDYLDYLNLDEESFVLALGDATGHGMKAGILVAAVKSYFQILATQLPPALLLEAMNAHITAMDLQQMFMALTVVRVHEFELEVAFAGMPPLFLYRAATSQVERIIRPALYLGTRLTRNYESMRLALAPGDVILLTSDGLLEAFSPTGAMLGEAAVAACLAAHSTQHADGIMTALRQLHSSHTQGRPLHDDVTMAVIRVK